MTIATCYAISVDELFRNGGIMMKHVNVYVYESVCNDNSEDWTVYAHVVPRPITS